MVRPGARLTGGAEGPGRLARRACRQLPDRVADAHETGHDDPAVRASEAQLLPNRGADELEGIEPEAAGELLAARMRLGTELEHSVTYLKARARGRLLSLMSKSTNS